MSAAPIEQGASVRSYDLALVDGLYIDGVLLGYADCVRGLRIVTAEPDGECPHYVIIVTGVSDERAERMTEAGIESVIGQAVYPEVGGLFSRVEEREREGG